MRLTGSAIVATTPYLTLAAYRTISLLPGGEIDRVDADAPGFFAAQLVERTAYLNARLAKRYATPFVAPCPEIVTGWLAKLIDAVAIYRGGFKPTDESALKIDSREATALAEIKEAADSEAGLFELPLRADTTASGIARGMPLAYSEASPYVHRDRQGAAGRIEDAAHDGTRR